MNESSRASTDVSAEAEENELHSQNDVPSETEATQTTPKPSNNITSQHSIITEFDCMRHFLCAYRHLNLVYFALAEHLLPAWHSFALHPQLYAAIYSQSFVNPTPIQSQTIPKALSGRDVIGVAETVSDYHFAPHVSLPPVLRDLGKLSLMVYLSFTDFSSMLLLHHSKQNPVAPCVPWFSHRPVNLHFKSPNILTPA